MNPGTATYGRAVALRQLVYSWASAEAREGDLTAIQALNAHMRAQHYPLGVRRLLLELGNELRHGDGDDVPALERLLDRLAEVGDLAGIPEEWALPFLLAD